MTSHLLKCWVNEFEAIERGVKRFEVRRNVDRDFAVGDVLVLEKWDPGMYTSAGGYVFKSGTMFVPVTLRARVTYILHGGRFDLPPGLCVMSIELEPPP